MSTEKATTSTPDNRAAGTGAHERDDAELLDFSRIFGDYTQHLSPEDRLRIADAERNDPAMYASLKKAEKMNLGRWLAANPDRADAVIAALTKREAHTDTAEEEQVPEGRPADFEEYDYDDAVAQADQDARLAPVRNEAKRRLGLGTISSAPLVAYAGVLNFADRLKARRQDKLDAKTAGMNEGERIAFMEERDRRRARIATIAGGAIMAATLVWGLVKAKNAWETGGGSGTAQNLADQAGNGGGAPNDVPNDTPDKTPGLNSREALDQAILKQYDNSDKSFYDFANKDFRGDFGPGLVGNDKDGAMGFGFTDWMSRNKHEPNGLANLVSGLKLDGHGDSLADRNAFADALNGDKKAHALTDIMVQKALRDPSQFKVESMSITTPYDTTYMVDRGGEPMIATQKYVDHGGSAFKITNAKTGEVTFWRKDCGAYQQIWPRERVVSQPVAAAPQRTVEQPAPRPRTVVAEKPPRVVTERPPTPVEQPPVDTPTPPTDTPEQPQPPVQNLPKDPTEDHNVSDSLRPDKRMGDDRVGAGDPQTEDDVQAEPDTYKAPEPATDNNDRAPDARPTTSHDRGQQQQASTSTGAGSGNNDGVTRNEVGE